MNENRNASKEALWVCRAADGDWEAFDKLANEYRTALTSFARRWLENPEDVADVVQETFVKAALHVHEINLQRPVSPWLYRICANCCADLLRSKKRRPVCVSLSVEPSAYGANDSHEWDEIEGLRADLESLPKRYQRILWMRLIQEKEISEIAIELATPEGTVKSWLFRARMMMRQRVYGSC